MAPKLIIDQISKFIRDFMWRGGKGNEIKFHLVIWDIVKHPMMEGGLQIRDPGSAKLVFERKFL